MRAKNEKTKKRKNYKTKKDETKINFDLGFETDDLLLRFREKLNQQFVRFDQNNFTNNINRNA